MLYSTYVNLVKHGLEARSYLMKYASSTSVKKSNKKSTIWA